jgi:hypothetical protein
VRLIEVYSENFIIIVPFIIHYLTCVGGRKYDFEHPHWTKITGLTIFTVCK